MYLLSRSPEGDLHLKEFFSNPPPYAILSHRWEDDEPTFQDIINPLNQNTVATGIEKLHFCGRQAARDGLSWFWVDTVCINKESSAQLTEALNSMFRWYGESAKCYVYMSDVGKLDPDFERSAWFTRGWTLQELLAPKCVEFYSASGFLLATKRFLEPQIEQITGVPRDALQGRSLADFDLEERMSWVDNRFTTRVEDRAYCLMGIFDIFMPVIYGEGERAFERLIDEFERRKRAVASRVASKPAGALSRELTTYRISPYEQAIIDNAFKTLDVGKKELVTGTMAVDFLTHSGLDSADLGNIWEVADVGHKGHLTKDEFTTAMVLIRDKLVETPNKHDYGKAPEAVRSFWRLNSLGNNRSP